jgi:hypothetical protein
MLHHYCRAQKILSFEPSCRAVSLEMAKWRPKWPPQKYFKNLFVMKKIALDDDFNR